MDFSELFNQTNRLCHFSPNGRFLANAVQYRLIIRDAQNLQIQHIYTCLDAIQHIEWSSDSAYVLCGMYKRGLIQVWSNGNSDWKCKIDEGSVGVVSAVWSPDGRHILSTAQFHLRITVWSLVDESVLYMKYPNAYCQKGLDFSKNGKYLALAERRQCKDYISIFDVDGWQLLNNFPTDTRDLAIVQWSPDSLMIAVAETCMKYNVLLYMMDGRCLYSYSAYDITGGLGIKSMSWSPTSQMLALGSYDQKVRLLNHLTMKLIVDFPHSSPVDASRVVVYKEVAKQPQLLRGESVLPPGMVQSTNSRYDILEDVVSLLEVMPDPKKANPKMGVGSLAFSPDSAYFYTINDNMPTTLWIWDLKKFTLAAVLVQQEVIKDVSWGPDQSHLALCTGNNKVYMWSPVGALSVEIPAEATFQTNSLRWNISGDSLLLIGSSNMCLCFINRNKTAPVQGIASPS